MRKLDPATYRAVPWRNGGGTTTLALLQPASADLDTFEVRVSTARVEADGPFSEYPGVDRTLIVTDGAGLTLETADGARITLDQASPPFAFTGDDPVRAALVAGPVVDFNVMTRRATMRHRATKVSLEDARSVVCAGELTLLLVLAGEVVAEGDDEALVLARGDVLTLTRPEESITVRAAPEDTSARLLVVDVFRRPGPESRRVIAP